MGLSFIYAAPAFPIDNQVPKDWAEDEAQSKNFAGQADLFNIPGVSFHALDMPPGTGVEHAPHSDLRLWDHYKGLNPAETRRWRGKDAADWRRHLQKGTNHMWTNTHPTEWARIYFVLTNALPISIAGVGDLEAKVLSKVGV